MKEFNEWDVADYDRLLADRSYFKLWEESPATTRSPAVLDLF